MTGHSNDVIVGMSVLWPDANLERIDAGYDEFTIRVREDAGTTKVVRCLGYVGFQMIGFWDDLIVEKAMIHSNHPFIFECERRLESLPETGSATRVPTGNYLLEIVLIDGCKLWVCSHEFQCEEGY